MRRLAVGASLLVMLAAAQPAAANPLVHWHRNWMPPSRVSHRRYMEVSDQQDCGTPGWNPRQFMAAHHANVFRLVTTSYYVRVGAALQCVQNLRKAGVHRIYVSLHYDPGTTPRHVAAQVRETLRALGPVWAFSIGNEQDLREQPRGYVAEWNAAEPVLARRDPAAIRVFGEASPWGGKWLAHALATDPPGVQVVSFHCYDTAIIGPHHGGLRHLPSVSAAVEAAGYPLWCSEMAPDTRLSGWILHVESPAAFHHTVRAELDQTSDVRMLSYYRWPAIGAN